MKIAKSKVYLIEFQGVEYECKFIGIEGDYHEFQRTDKKGSILLLEQALNSVREKE